MPGRRLSTRITFFVTHANMGRVFGGSHLTRGFPVELRSNVRWDAGIGPKVKRKSIGSKTY